MNVLIIPYRNRKPHLDYFIENTLPLLNKNMENIEIIVVEQTEGNLFNRGKLLNVGFKERSNGEFFFTHDVDINPYEETIKSLYNKNIDNNEFMGIYTSSSDTLGGVVKFSKEAFEKVNGFPNDIWGWGMEDIALQNRVKLRKLNITKNILDNNQDKDKYFKVFDDIDDRLIGKDWQTAQFWEINQYKRLPNGIKEQRLEKNGLSNLDYQIIKREKLAPNVEKLIVELGSSEGKGIETAVNELMNKAFGSN